MKNVLLGLLAGLAFGSGAMAADLPPGGGYYDPPPIFTWTGFYGGINGGLGVGRFTGNGGGLYGGAVGGMVGGTVGYNYQVNNVVVGGEADLDWSGVNGSGSPSLGLSGSANANLYLTARARLGYTFGRFMVFITGGYAGANMQAKVNDTTGAPNLYVTQTNFLSGYAAGAGVEYAFTRHISAKAEYLFNEFNSQGVYNGTRDQANVGLKFSAIRLGVAYHF